MLTPICIFCATAAISFHRFLGEPSGPMALLSLLAGYVLYSDLAMWVQMDAAQRGIALVYDFDSLFFLVWPLATLVYLFRTRGWGAVMPVAIYFVAAAGGILLAALLAYPQSASYIRAQMS